MLTKFELEKQNLRSHLEALITDHGLVGIKAGTEVEDMTFSEIGFLRQLTSDLLPLVVKIGGPEARNDMRSCLDLNVDGFIAPMVESPFALFKFISSLRAVTTSEVYLKLRKGINIESKVAVNSLAEIFGCAEIHELNQVTAARSDLSASLACATDDSLVIGYCQKITEFAHAINLETSIGGKIIPRTITNLLDSTTADMVNTRHMVLSCPLISTSPVGSIRAAILFEIELYRFYAKHFSERERLHLDRISQLELRLQKKTALHN